MNSQNILSYGGTKFDVRLDSSEFYDYEIGKTEGDYATDILDLDTPISYSTLKINSSLSGLSCSRNSIKLLEINNTANDTESVYSGLTVTLDYDNFVNHYGSEYVYTLLDDDIFVYTGLTGETHYFRIYQYNTSLYIDPLISGLTESQFISGLTSSVIDCQVQLSHPDYCCPTPQQKNAKPWAYQFNSGLGTNYCTELLKRRTEKGWTLDFIFNRESLPWSSGGVFYYYGVRGSDDVESYADNNLSFQFTADRKIKWIAVHYTGYCQDNGTYAEDFYVASGLTPTLCTTGLTKDFNVTITFDRYKHYTGCDIENDGGWNDLVGGVIVDPYTPESGSSVTSTQIINYSTDEELNKRWAEERQRRLGILKIYLNGRPIYKLENWEEIIPSYRGVQPFVQSWGAGTGLMGNLHSGECCFNIKSIKYYEEPLDFLHVRHNFLTRLNSYDFFICGIDCEDDIFELNDGHITQEDGGILLGDGDNHLIYNG